MKKLATMALSVGLIGAMVAGGSLAYLSDTDSDVNVMTLGNVKIEQIEKERIEQSDSNTADTNLQEFKQDKPLFPAIYNTMDFADSYQQWPTGGGSAMFTDEMKNVQDKIVFVENTGASKAYVRTLFAFEQGDLTEAEFEALVGQNINATHWAWETVASNVEIEGNKYLIKVATYTGNAGDNRDVHPNGVLASGETTRPSLLQVMLYNTATNEDVEAIDGNKDGNYNILALSQAVQTAGFENAAEALNAGFGEVTAETAAEWLSGVIPQGNPVSTAAELVAAMEAGEDVYLTSDITLDSAVTVSEESAIDLNNHTLATVGLDFAAGGSIQNGTIESAGATSMVPHLKVSSGTLTMEDVNVVIDDYLNYQVSGNRSYGEYTGLEVADATAVLNDCNVKVSNETYRTWNYTYGITVNNANVTLNGGSIVIESAGASSTDLETAISGMGNSTVTMNNVSVQAETVGTTMGNLVLKTTDKTVTDSDFASYGGSFELSYI